MPTTQDLQLQRQRDYAKSLWLQSHLAQLGNLLKWDHDHGFLSRIVNALESEGIRTIEELLTWDERSLLTIENISTRSVEFIFTLLEKIGFARNSRLNDPKFEPIKNIPLP